MIWKTMNSIILKGSIIATLLNWNKLWIILGQELTAYGISKRFNWPHVNLYNMQSIMSNTRVSYKCMEKETVIQWQYGTITQRTPKSFYCLPLVKHWNHKTMHTCSNSMQASKLRYPQLKKLLVDINWNIEKKILFKLEEELESSTEISLLKLDFIRQTGILFSLGVISCSWNRTSSKKPHRKLKSSICNSTMLRPEVGIFSVLSVGGDSIKSEFAGTASNTSACRITGQATSRHGCNSAETTDDWIPSRNGSHCISNNQMKKGSIYPQL